MNFSLGARIGMIVGVLSAAVGAAVAIAAAPLEGGLLVVVLLGVAIGAFWIALAPQVRRDRLANTGHSTRATVLSIEETGWTVQENYGLARLRLLVEPPDGGEPYEATVKTLINRFEIPAYQPGARLAVVVDPDDRSKVAVA